MINVGDRVKVIEAPGYEDFEGEVVLDVRGMFGKIIVMDDGGEIHPFMLDYLHKIHD